MRFLFLVLMFTACTPRFIDPDQTPERIADWLEAPRRFERASGVSVRDPKLAPCAPGPGCAYTVPGFDGEPNVLGRASWKKAEARVVEGIDAEQGAHVVLHEWGHTMGLLHVTSATLMNPIARDGYGCISEAELVQLCTLWECTRWEPECSAGDDWDILVPRRYIDPSAEPGSSYEVSPQVYRGLVGSGKLLWGEIRRAL